MGKLKKHELLEKAMRDYPAGTVVEWPSGLQTLNGVYNFVDNHRIVDSNKSTVYNGYMFANKANKEGQSILTGKCAIQVNNEREFKLLMEHYKSKGWEWTGIGGRSILKDLKFPYSISYGNYFTWAKDCDNEDVKIIPFADFAAEVGIKVPVFVMTSQDGVELYKDDKHIEVVKYGERWIFSNSGGVAYIRMGAMCNTESIKAFSTKEAAEKWIEEQNKPKSTTVKLYHGGTAEIYSDHICLHGGVKVSPSDLEDMMQAYKSLQS